MRLEKWMSMEHIAAPPSPDGVQCCSRCGVILADYRNTYAPEGTPPVKTWDAGELVWAYENGPLKEWTILEPGEPYVVCGPIGYIRGCYRRRPIWRNGRWNLP